MTSPQFPPPPGDSQQPWDGSAGYPPPSDYPGGQAWAGFEQGGQPPPPQQQQRPWWQRATSLIRVGIVAVVGVSIVAGWLGGARRDDSGAINDGGTLAATELRVGDCYNEPDGDTFSEVSAAPCTEPHDSEVFHVSQLTSATFPTEDTILAAAESDCLPAFASYVGIDFQQSSLDIGYISPSQELWDDGDRSLVCTAHNVDGSQLTASVKGAAR